ncbi:protease inhibitor I42 family protein [Nocardia gamkensis]|uniref:Protease inhibitor I42 family protein n=1 Tax=Nocardia gamkensis TaxID=352869 RepID=A0A7X6L581_9NOCA|nr:protease inhibitor I42 family protein [Nocardia gamkensis]NKY27905.1 protease inhibitor I42 family protein [Nocardia gamkensis]NQE67552.1 hypothetical protein [Nocardia gamkensis]
MRKSLLVLLLCSTVVGCGNDSRETHPAEDAKPVVRVGDADDGQQRRLLVGQRLVVALPANPSTGYSWSVAQMGVAAGVTPLKLEYTRPWDQGLAPARTFSLTIEVQ